MAEPLELLRTTNGDLSEVLGALTADEGWQPTGCAGGRWWTLPSTC